MGIASVFDRLFKYADPYAVLEVLASKLKPIVEEVSIYDSLWRVVAEPVYSPVDRPWTDISHVDGYAVRSRDTVVAREKGFVRLRLVEGVDPRSAHLYSIREGETVYVETGYPLPRGADAVVPVEATRVEDGYVYIYSSVDEGYNVFHRGSDFSRGELVINSGEVVTPQHQKLLMDLGVEEVRVYRRPRVAVVSVGDELVDKPVDPSSGYIAASTRLLVKTVVEYYGGEVVYSVIVGDKPNEIKGIVSDLLDNVDIILTIGGVSMGKRDYTWVTLAKEFKPDYVFRGLKIHPGRSTSGLVLGDKVVINLPGLPQSTIAATIFLVIPLLNHLQGLGLNHRLPYIEARLSNRLMLDKYIGFYRVRYARIDYDKMEAYVEQDVESYCIKSVVRSNGVAIIKPEIRIIERGSRVKIYYLEPLHKYNRI